MNKLLIFIILTLTSSVSYCQISHNEWTELLKKHVSNNGQVSYKTFLNDSTKLNHYLSNLEKNPPQEDWSKNRLLAYWINADKEEKGKRRRRKEKGKGRREGKKEEEPSWDVAVGTSILTQLR
ncbi:MAG TPA: hypothetical protein PLD02_13410 [Saprospiraceae bacterium]|nr:hypothetical protein [Saprospiraceae bacterium]